MDEHANVGTTDVRRTTEAEIVVSQERLAVSTGWHEHGRVRVAKRVVTEERTVTVTVRREVLLVEDIATGADLTEQLAGSPSSSAAGEASADGTVRSHASTSATPVLEITLHEEEVRLVAVPRERVRLYIDRVTGTQDVSGTVSREDIELIETPADTSIAPHEGAAP